MPEYVHKDGHREHTVAGGARDRVLAAKARDGRTNWHLASETPAEPEQHDDPED